MCVVKAVDECGQSGTNELDVMKASSDGTVPTSVTGSKFKERPWKEVKRSAPLYLEGN